MIRPDPLGIVDIMAGVMLYYTVSPVPEALATAHAAFLIFKGIGSIIEPMPLGIPIFILGGAADLISASILLVGQPPVFPQLKEILAFILVIKGMWTLAFFMG